jgi:hypothetical protein
MRRQVAAERLVDGCVAAFCNYRLFPSVGEARSTRVPGRITDAKRRALDGVTAGWQRSRCRLRHAFNIFWFNARFAMPFTVVVIASALHRLRCSAGCIIDPPLTLGE